MRDHGAPMVLRCRRAVWAGFVRVRADQCVSRRLVRIMVEVPAGQSSITVYCGPILSIFPPRVGAGVVGRR